MHLIKRNGVKSRHGFAFASLLYLNSNIIKTSIISIISCSQEYEFLLSFFFQLAAESWRVLKGLHEKSGVFSSDTSFGNIRCVSWLSKISSQELCAETQSHYILREIPLITVLARTHSENRPETRVC